MKTPFSIIVAVDEKFGIGQNGGLPWNLPGDMKHFKEVTLGSSNAHDRNVVIMGRKTWESIPERFRPLPGRLNVVLSRDHSCAVPDGVAVASNFDHSLRLIDEQQLSDSSSEVFVIGGAEIFTIAINHHLCTKIHMTHIRADMNCDRFFPAIPSTFKEVSRSQSLRDGNIEYFFSQYKRFDAS